MNEKNAVDPMQPQKSGSGITLLLGVIALAAVLFTFWD